jgi:hypothetical protein
MNIKHPKSADAYTGGHEEDAMECCGLFGEPDDDDVW